MVCLRSAVLALAAFASISSATMAKHVRTGSADTDGALAKRSSAIADAVLEQSIYVEIYTTEVTNYVEQGNLDSATYYTGLIEQSVQVSL